MIKHTIEISKTPAYLSSQRKQLLIKRRGDTTRFFPFEDVGFVIVDQPQVTYSHAALQSLVDSNAALIICGANHLPAGILLPLGEHSEVVWRIQDQIAISKPLRKQLWQQIVQAKIEAQASNLPPKSTEHRKLKTLARTVKSGDPSNHEAQAARIYWSAWLEGTAYATTDAFRRERFGPGPNPLLNYGYSLLRAAVARALVCSGLLPALGLQHSHRGNAFCLADDLMEPLRPMVDAQVRRCVDQGQLDLNAATKADLLKLLVAEVEYRDVYGPLMAALHTYAASLAKCYAGETKTLEIPKPCTSTDTAVCGSL
jgi:CRISPR-associated protein Cas1